ncbi:oligosaccharide flippase family protein [Paenibacillus sp. GCM10012307]|uniref:Polysaccharide biosynthesis protein n=1 Tax=Paenibacillus roseus TaxID=2798579 RepID=A0A934J2X0_9BACL|nr:polysaccharide biosynthesis protein [Paenibacillus roseus]MBJ6362294.1 polysaccharide biosynthesis protein [Paenibacillus roseus]
MIKKDSLLKGTLILAAAALVARFLGLFQRIPLDRILGEAGGTYFAQANNVYLFLLIIATGGIPSAISKMVSERYAQGRVHEGQQIYRAALLFGALSGMVMAVLLYVLSPFIVAEISGYPGAKLALQAIAPSLLLFPAIAMMRGYFQGRQIMSAGAISQIIEQIFRVITAVGLALLLLSIGYNSEWLAAGASFGSVLGSVGAFLVMLWYARKLRRQDAADKTMQATIQHEKNAGVAKLKLRTIYGELFRLSVPIVITAMTVQLLYMFDTMLFNRVTGAFYSPEDALAALNWLGMRAQGIAGIPPILAIALSTSIIPVISSAYSVGNMTEVQRQSSLVMRMVLFTGIPAALSLTVAAVSVTGFLFEGTGGSAVVAALTAGTIFQITMMTTNSMLFGIGKQTSPLRHTFAGIAVKVIGSIVLGPFLGVYGLIIASTLCFIIITALNLGVIRKEVSLNVLGGRWVRYILTVAITGTLGYAVDVGGRTLLESLPNKLQFFLSAACSGLAMIASYLILLVLLKIVTAQDVASFPGPLRKVFTLLLRRLGGSPSPGQP